MERRFAAIASKGKHWRVLREGLDGESQGAQFGVEHLQLELNQVELLGRPMVICGKGPGTRDGRLAVHQGLLQCRH
ncbi:hypothetical protein U724_12330 [Pseudomonas chlororaphis subsp. aurantiaca PB-St2]|nr:hypothetical protein U724_12330 [Pseudomonas chlororaphis subsp. aurantiaca PB-St2]